MNTVSQGDPFNYPMPGRRDLMSLSTISQSMDQMKTTTKRFTTGRGDSSNLDTSDIAGKLILELSNNCYRSLTKAAWIEES